AGDSALLDEGVDRFGSAVAELQGGGLLPGVGEAVQVVKLRGVVARADEQAERAACIDRLELAPVSDQQSLRAGLLDLARDPIQRRGASEGGFIDDDELTRLERGAVHEMVLPPLRRVLRR